MNVQPENKRRATRLIGALGVRFTVNGGESQTSDTLNFTHRSLAIRTDAAVSKGDRIIADVDDLPPLQGEVVRIFPEGFAVRLSEASIALIAHARASTAELDADVQMPVSDSAAPREHSRKLSPVFKFCAPFPAWGRFATSRRHGKPAERHVLSIISTRTIEFEYLRSVWLRVEDTRWIARVINIGNRGNQSIAVIAINDWQMRMMAIHGFSISVVGIKSSGWTMSSPAEPIAAHLSGDREDAFAHSA